MPLNGDVKTFPLSAIVKMIHDERKTGSLAVMTPRRGCSIYFKMGTIIHVRGNTDPELRLGALLVANNLISQDRLEDMLAVCKAMEERLGVVLLRRNYITQEDLASILHLQFKEVVTTTLSWDDAKFTYKDGLDGLVQDIEIQLDPVRLVAEAKKREEFKGIIPNDHVVFQINPRVDTSKSVHAARDLRVLLLLDGRRSVAQIIKETGYSRLAVYRSLALLHAQNAIVRKDADKQSAKTGTVDLTPIVSVYRSLLQLATDHLTEELGAKKAAASLENCLRQSGYYEQFLRAFTLDQEPAANVGRMQNLTRQHGKTLSHQDLIKGFNQAVVGLLREDYQFLGLKAARISVQRMRATLERVPANQKPLAQAVSSFLAHYESEDYLRGIKKTASIKTVDPATTGGDRAHPLKLDGVSGTSVLDFYNDMFVLILGALEQEVGDKARGLLHGLIRNSKHSDTIMAQFDLQSAPGTDPIKLKDQVKVEQLKLTTPDLVQTLQQALGGLLAEESRLLGPKATDSTFSQMVERSTEAHQQLKPLLNRLSAHVGGKTGSKSLSA